MKTKLKVDVSKDLYQFWQQKLTTLLNQDLKQSGSQLLINLASKEYYSAVDLTKIDGQVIKIVFNQVKHGKRGNYGILTKIARGRMIEYMLKNNAKDVDGLKGFSWKGYKFEGMDGDEMNFLQAKR